MSIHDEIGDLSGSQIHYWPSERTRTIVKKFNFSTERSAIELDRDVNALEPEIRAAEIARNLYGDHEADFGTEAFTLAAIRARTIASLIDPPLDKTAPKQLVGFIGQKHFLVQWAQELAWLSFAFDFGATDADLLAWGVDEFVVIQLLWWQKRNNETRLQQHIRALRNGWALSALSQSVRDAYGNLIRFADKGQIPDAMLKHFAADFVEVRELLDFFSENSEQLSETQLKQWAKAFEKNVEFIAPDARGRWASLPKVSLARGELRTPAVELARFFERENIKPTDLSKLDPAYFGRVGDAI